MKHPVNNPAEILKSSQNILLIDWPNPGVPRALLEAGFTVFGFSPGSYSRAEIIPFPPGDVAGDCIFPPSGDGEMGYLVFRRLTGIPPSIDIVNVYRPVEEFPEILEQHALPYGAKSIWLHPPAISGDARRLTEDKGLVFVENQDIATLARSLTNKT